MNSQSQTKSVESKRCFAFSLIAIFCAALSATLRTLSLFFFYDKIGYYQTGAILPTVSSILFVAAIVFFAISARFLIKPAKEISAPSPVERAAALIPMGAMIAELIGLAAALVKALPDKQVKWYDMLLLVFGAIAVVFFASIAFSKQPSVLTSLTGVAFLVWLALTWISSYLDFTVPMNSPDKLFFQFGAVGAALLVFSELRALFRIPQLKTYYFSFFTGILTVAVSSIPDIIGHFSGLFASYSLLGKDLVLLALLVYAVVRLICVSRSDTVRSQSDGKESLTDTDTQGDN